MNPHLKATEAIRERIVKLGEMAKNSLTEEQAAICNNEIAELCTSIDVLHQSVENTGRLAELRNSQKHVQATLVRLLFDLKYAV